MTSMKMQGTLSDVRVQNLTSNIPGPSATAFLADMGAEVIKVERPKQGDDARGMGSYIDGESTHFLAINRNKRSVIIDIRRRKGRS